MQTCVKTAKNQSKTSKVCKTWVNFAELCKKREKFGNLLKIIVNFEKFCKNREKISEN